MSNPTQQSLAKLERLVEYLKRERLWGRRSDDFFRIRMGRLQRNSKIIKRKRDTFRQPHLGSIHAQAKDQCKEAAQKQSCMLQHLGASKSKGLASLLKDLGHEMKQVLARCEGHRTHLLTDKEVVD